MKLVSVQIGRPRNVQWHGKLVSTGIYKEPVDGRRIMVHRFNLNGDQQADLTVHGGPDKAIYVYPVEHYVTWAEELERSRFSFGQFGENFTVEGMLEETVCIGDIFRIGKAQFEVTQPRVPCYKLGIKMGSMRFPKRFLASGRTGYYLRVLEEGEVGAGDSIERIKTDRQPMTIQEAVRLAFFEQGDVAMLEKALRIHALSQEWRSLFQEQLAATTSIKTR
jgi:MOSC domain-containing protein YiiM